MEEINKGKGTIAKVIGSFIRLAVFVCIFGIMLYVFPTLAKAMDKTAGAICTLFGIEREISVFSDFYDISAIAINKVIYLAELAKDNIDGIYEEKREVSPILFTCAASPPCKGKSVTSEFGDRINPISGKKEVHTGIDIALPSGSEIYAAWPGTVTETGTDEIYGNYIVIMHSRSLFTRYCHLSEISAGFGKFVSAGEAIGRAGSTGWATGSHLHFEIIAGGNAVDPRKCFEI